MTAPFGTPASIRAEVVEKLPAPMRAEAILMLFDMGESAGAICRRLRMKPREAEALLTAHPLHRRRDDVAANNHPQWGAE